MKTQQEFQRTHIESFSPLHSILTVELHSQLVLGIYFGWELNGAELLIYSKTYLKEFNVFEVQFLLQY